MQGSLHNQAAGAELHFYGRLYGSKTTCDSDGQNTGFMELIFGNGDVYFHTPTELARAQKCSGVYKGTKYHFLAPGNWVDRLELSGYSRVYCDCENAFSNRQVMTFFPWYINEAQNAKIIFGAYDQTFDRIE